jgi:hypothetical protein
MSLQPNEMKSLGVQPLGVNASRYIRPFSEVVNIFVMKYATLQMMVAISTSICYGCVNEVHPLREGVDGGM